MAPSAVLPCPLAHRGAFAFLRSCLTEQRNVAPDTDSLFHSPPVRPLHASGEIAVQFLTGAREFARLAPQWNRIHEQAAAASVFNSWIWQYQWWQVYGAAQPLRILVALEHGQTLGILALYIQTISVLGLRVRLLRFVGSGADTHPDDLGPVLAPGREEAVARALAQAAFHVSDADVVLLTDIDPRSPL